MEAMENQSCVFLGIKVKPGPIERYKIENFNLDNTVDNLKSEAEKKANIPSASLELIHHGKILKDNATLQDSGVKSGEMVHVVKKKEPAPAAPSLNFTDLELQQLNATLRSLGCTPNATGWTRAMQLLNDESAVAEIIEHAPSLADDCVTLSILHEVELLAALGANVSTMRRGAEAHPDLVTALRHLMLLVRNRSATGPIDNTPTSGFVYSLEALSEDEEAEEDEMQDAEGRSTITQEQLAAALQAATEAVFTPARGGHEGLLRMLQASEQGDSSTAAARDPDQPATVEHPIITAEMFSEAITEALQRTRAAARVSANLAAVMDQNNAMDQSIAMDQNNAMDQNIATEQNIAMDENIAMNQNDATDQNNATDPNTSMDQNIAMDQNTVMDQNIADTPSTIDSPCAGSSGVTMSAERAGSSRCSGGSKSSSEGEFGPQLHRMHDLGLLDDTLNVRALQICLGDVNAAINVVFSGVIDEAESM